MSIGKGFCNRCNNELTGKQKRWCSSYCSKLGLKAEYRKRNPHKVREWKKKYLAGNKKITPSQRSSAMRRFGNECFRCHVQENLVVHHIKPMRCGGDHKIFNLMVFCDACHKLWHKKFDDSFWKT